MIRCKECGSWVNINIPCYNCGCFNYMVLTCNKCNKQTNFLKNGMCQDCSNKFNIKY
jgi:hypothetical protein